MNNNGIGPKNSPKQQTPPASPKEENAEGGGGFFGWFSKIVNVVTDATQMVRGTSNPDDNSKLTLTTANITIVGDSTSYLDKISEKAARSPIDYSKYRPTLAKAGDPKINGKYLSDEVSRTANSAYHSACRSNEKDFLAALYSLEANLQYQVAQHSALQKEIEELQRQKDALLNGQADAVKQNNADMVQRNIDTKTKQMEVENELLASVNTCLNQHGTKKKRQEAAEKFCTIETLTEKIKVLISNQNMVTKVSSRQDASLVWEKYRHSEFDSSAMSEDEKEYFKQLQNTDKDTKITVILNGFSDTILSKRKYKNSIEDLRKIRSELNRFLFMLATTHQYETLTSSSYFKDIESQMDEAILHAKSFEKYANQDGVKNAQQHMMVQELDKVEAIHKNNSNILLEKVQLLVEQIQSNHDPMQAITVMPGLNQMLPLLQALQPDEKNEGVAVERVIKALFGNAQLMEQCAEHKSIFTETLIAFKEFIQSFKDSQDLAKKAGLDNHADYKELLKLHETVINEYAAFLPKD